MTESISGARGNGPPCIAVIAGTRPEAIKLAPVVHALRRETPFAVRVIGTGQHRALFDTAAAGSGLAVDGDLDLIRPGQTPAALLARALPTLQDALIAMRPTRVVVQGDTASAYAGAVAASALGIPVAHVEAGLRTGHLADPFPEELFRRAIGRIADLHLAPTMRALEALRAENIAADRIVVTGNSGIDGLMAIRPDRTVAAALLEQGGARRPLMLATVRRRESRGERLGQIIEGLRKTATALGGTMLLPLHPSPALVPLARHLKAHPGISIVDPLPHPVIRALLDEADLVLTDSGGLLEEAATLGVPTVVLRATTERGEAVDAGRAILATKSDAILRAARAMLAKGRMPRSDLFGDGNAGPRIARAIARHMAAKAISPG